MPHESEYSIHLSFPYSELGVDRLQPGQVGKITLNVEVMSADKGGVTFMKHGLVEVTEDFKEMGLNEMRKKIGTVDDEEEPVNKSYKE